MKHRLIAPLLAVCLLALASHTYATTPKLISYQGKATDASGNPVADGEHTVRFDLFSNAATGTSLWNEQTSVTTSGGLFTHLLGSVNPFPYYSVSAYEEMWLQVTFDGGNLTPRTRLASVPYAFHVQSIHNSEGGNIRDGLAIYDPYTDNEIAGLGADGAGSSNLWLKGGDVDQSYHSVTLDAATNSLEFVDRLTGNDTTVFGMSNIKMPNDGSVYFPDNAINNREIADEPGVSFNLSTEWYYLNSDDNYVTAPLISQTISLPQSGYVVARGAADIISYYTGGASVGMQFGVSPLSDDFAGSYHSIYVSPSFGDGNYRYTLSAERVLWFPAGVHTIYFLGRPGSEILTNYWAVCTRTLTLMYFPTAYGSVQTIVAPEEASNFENAAPLTVDGQTHYQVDLRELELRAAKAEAEAERARADAEHAQRELLRAKLDASGVGNR